MSADAAAQRAERVDVKNVDPANDPVVRRVRLTSREGSLVEQFQEVAAFLREYATPEKNLVTCGTEYGVDGVYLIDHTKGNPFLQTRSENGAPESFLIFHDDSGRKWIENLRPNKKESIHSEMQKMRFMLGG